MAATNASLATITIQRARDGGKAWEAIAGKLTVATAMSLDTLAAVLTERHGGLVAIIRTSHVSKRSTPESKAERAPRARKSRKAK